MNTKEKLQKAEAEFHEKQKQRVALNNSTEQIKKTAEEMGVSLNGEVEALDKAIEINKEWEKEFEKRLRKIVRSDPALKRLTEIPGIGEKTAGIICAHAWPADFPNVSKFRQFCALGDADRTDGNRRLKSTFIFLATASLMHEKRYGPNWASKFYRQAREDWEAKGGCGKKHKGTPLDCGTCSQGHAHRHARRRTAKEFAKRVWVEFRKGNGNANSQT